MKREVVNHLKDTYHQSERKACSLSGISRRTHRYKAKKKDDIVLIDLLSDLSSSFPGYGFWKLYRRLPQGHGYNHKRVYRVYKQMGLNN